MKNLLCILFYQNACVVLENMYIIERVTHRDERGRVELELVMKVLSPTWGGVVGEGAVVYVHNKEFASVLERRCMH